MVTAKTIESLITTIFSQTVKEKISSNPEKKRMLLETLDEMIEVVKEQVETDKVEPQVWARILVKIESARAEITTY